MAPRWFPDLSPAGSLHPTAHPHLSAMAAWLLGLTPMGQARLEAKAWCRLNPVSDWIIHRGALNTLKRVFFFSFFLQATWGFISHCILHHWTTPFHVGRTIKNFANYFSFEEISLSEANVISFLGSLCLPSSCIPLSHTFPYFYRPTKPWRCNDK